MKTTIWRIVAAGVTAGALAASGTSAGAQHPVEKTEWTVSPLRTSGQPVIPIFDGWYRNPDGAYQLCFGYYNLNTEEVIDISLGPDNFIEPKGFDGAQPTHFMLSDAPGGLMRHWCVFTVKVPKDFGTQWQRPRLLQPGDPAIRWTLRRNGQTYSVPGHVGSSSYELDEADAPAREVTAPVVKFEPDGPQGRGRNGIIAGPLRAAVGQPLALNVSVTDPEGQPAKPPRPVPATGQDAKKKFKWWVGWGKHQGPGRVTFDKPVIELVEKVTLAQTTATFAEPGDYLLRVQAIDSTGSFEFHCCWTNGFVQVTVTK